MREKKGRGWTEKRTRGGRRNTEWGGTEKRTIFGTHGHTDRGSYRGGAHLKIPGYKVNTIIL